MSKIKVANPVKMVIPKMIKTEANPAKNSNGGSPLLCCFSRFGRLEKKNPKNAIKYRKIPIIGAKCRIPTSVF